MSTQLRASTLESLGLGSALHIFQNGRLPVATADLVDQVFGPQNDRGALLISGANGIVGAGKAAQLGSRLEPYGVPIVALDFPSAPDGLGKQYHGLVAAFGRETGTRIMSNMIRFTYDGQHLPPQIQALKPRFALEAVPEVLEIKKAHYEILRATYPGIEIRSVTSGFPSSELGVGVAHPAFPHEINKVWEMVEGEPSTVPSGGSRGGDTVTQLLWSLGLIPMAVSDHWSFVLDVLFCGVTLAALRCHEATNIPFWKIDKYVRKLVGPNPFRAHDSIGAKGSNFLTWSCLHHLSEHYGPLFTPTTELVERKDSGETWYPHNHLRPMVDWQLDGAELEELETWIYGALFQMMSLLAQEERSHLAQINCIGELCAQFTPGVPAFLRRYGVDNAVRTVEVYHRLYPAAAESAWYPQALARVETPEWQQLYVNAEHDGKVGVITLGRESYSWDVDDELNRALDWLLAAGIERVILSGDFHLSTQLVGADTREFFPGLGEAEKATEVSASWSKTARRLAGDFATSVAFLNGKRCLGGMLELVLHCDYVVATDEVSLGFPEVTLPVIPGMEACHLPFRRGGADDWPKILGLLLGGKPVKARDAAPWLIDHAAGLDEALALTWAIASGADHGVAKRPLVEEPLPGVTEKIAALGLADEPSLETARQAIAETVRASCEAPFSEAIMVQARHSGGFMATPACRKGAIGTMFKKTMAV